MPFTVRPLLFKLHLYLSVAISLYVAILGITGAILAFSPEIDRLTHADLAYVTPAPERLSFAALGQSVTKAYPGQKIFGYALGEAPDQAARVAVGAPAASAGMLVYVNPYTGQILGSRTTDIGILGMIRSIHQGLTPHPNRSGLTRSFISWISVTALFLLVSGIWLWWPRMRFGIGAGGGRPFWYDLHATLGIAAAAFLVLLTISGIIMGFSDTTFPMLYALTGSQPVPQPKIPAPPADTAQSISVDRAFAIGAEALPGTTPVSITGPTPRGVYFVGARTPSDHDPEARSVAIIDQYTGAVLSALVGDTAPAGRRVWNFNRAIHFGTVFGIPSKAIMALASLIIVLEVVSGAVMWFKRVPFRSTLPALAAAVAVTVIAIYTVLAPTA